jgi:hypothetical protein
MAALSSAGPPDAVNGGCPNKATYLHFISLRVSAIKSVDSGLVITYATTPKPHASTAAV